MASQYDQTDDDPEAARRALLEQMGQPNDGMPDTAQQTTQPLPRAAAPAPAPVIDPQIGAGSPADTAIKQVQATHAPAPPEPTPPPAPAPPAPAPAAPAPRGFTPGQSYQPGQIPGLRQYDPGVFTDGQGHYFTPNGSGGGTYVGTDPSVFHIGQQPPAPAAPAPATPVPTAPVPAAAPGPVGGGPGDGRGVGIDGIPSGRSAPDRPGPGGPPGATTDYNAQMRQFLMRQLTDASGPVDETNPDIAPGITAYKVAKDRALQQTRAGIAERNYARGTLNTGGYDTQLSQATENAGQDTANYTGQAVWQEAQAKRQQLTEMLKTASQFGLTEQAQRIQQQIATIDANLRSRGLTQQGDQFTRSLGQNNTQFGDRLGYDYADLLARINRDTMLGGLQG